MNRSAVVIFSIVMVALVADEGEARPGHVVREALAVCSNICFKPGRPWKEVDRLRRQMVCEMRCLRPAALKHHVHKHPK